MPRSFHFTWSYLQTNLFRSFKKSFTFRARNENNERSVWKFQPQRCSDSDVINLAKFHAISSRKSPRGSRIIAVVNVAIGVGAKISCGARPQKISNETISKRFCGNAADPALQIVKMYQHWIIEDIFLPTRRQILHQIFPRNVIEQASSTYFPLLRSLSLFQCGGETRYSSYFSRFILDIRPQAVSSACIA